MSWAGAVVLLLVMSLGLSVKPALAHGEATLTVSPTVATSGSIIKVEGEGVEPGEVFTIGLEGVNLQATLGSATVGDDEDFHREFTLPITTPPGVYQVRATSADGEVLVAELTLESDATLTDSTVPAKPSSELMQLDRHRSGGEVIAIAAGLLVSAALGVVLFRVR